MTRLELTESQSFGSAGCDCGWLPCGQPGAFGFEPDQVDAGMFERSPVPARVKFVAAVAQDGSDSL